MRIQTLKEVILHLHRGEAPETVREQLKALIAEVDSSEVAAMEQQLMADGLSAEQVRSMCDVHADVLKEVMAPPCPSRPLPSGHPAQHLRAENSALQEAVTIARLRAKPLGTLPDGVTPVSERLSLLEAFQPLIP